MQVSRRLLRASPLAVGALSAFGLLLVQAPALAATLSAEAAAVFDIDNEFVEGLADPTDAFVLPDGRVVIIQKLGDVAVKTPGPTDPVVTHIEVEHNHNERGLLGVVADPGFATNSFVYFYASMGDDANNRHHILRYKLGADSKLTDQKVVLDMGLKGPANHNGGGIDIYQGNLYMGVGDTGANSKTPSNHFGSCLNQANGKVLRISLAEATLGQPVADNPLMNATMVTGCDSTGGDFGMRAPEKRIYAWGFRNPFRLWTDRSTGKVWVGDVGEETKEEISVVDKGKHYGYPFEEGTQKWNQQFMPANGCAGIKPGDMDGPACTPPVTDWDRGGGGTSIGGRILDGCNWPAEWKKRYIFGDHEQGKVWTIAINDTRDGVTGARTEFASTSGIAAIKMGTDNALYLVERGGGRVARVTLKNDTAMPGSCQAVYPDAGGNPGGGGSGGGANAGGNGNPSAGNGNNPGAGNGTGGAGNGTSGTPGTPGAGTTSTTGGTNGATPGGGTSADEGGCGCRAVGAGTGSALGLSFLAGALGLALQRRRRSRRS